MKCPTCGHGDHRILHTRAAPKGIRRQRECLKCTFRWHTLEAPEAEIERAATIVEIFRDLQKLMPGE